MHQELKELWVIRGNKMFSPSYIYTYSLWSSTWGSATRATRSTARLPRQKPSRPTSRSVPRSRGTSASRLHPWSSTAPSRSSTRKCTNTSSSQTRNPMRLSCTTGPPSCRAWLALFYHQEQCKLNKKAHQPLHTKCTQLYNVMPFQASSLLFWSQ